MAELRIKGRLTEEDYECEKEALKRANLDMQHTQKLILCFGL
jgi:hypothetical protein